MRIRGLIAVIGALAPALLLAFLGCSGDAPTSQPEAFELEGGWTYLGPSDGPHDLTIGNGSMVYTDVAGMWSSKWTIKSYDNELHHFQVAFDSGSGSYLPMGQSMSGTYELSESLLTVQLANGSSSYPTLVDAGTCTSETDGNPVAECRLYIKQK